MWDPTQAGRHLSRRSRARWRSTSARALARAWEIVDEVVAAVKGWREEAQAVGIARGEQEEMAPAFAVAEAA